MAADNMNRQHLPSTSDTSLRMAEHFQMWVSYLAELDGPFSSTDLAVLFSALIALLRGIKFLSEDNDPVAKDLEQLSHFVSEKKKALQSAQDQRNDYKHQLNLLKTDIESVSQEIKMLEELKRFSEVRNSLASFASDKRPYLDILRDMSMRAGSDATRLKELEKECVDKIDAIEACLKQKLENEEKKWEFARQKAQFPK